MVNNLMNLMLLRNSKSTNLRLRFLSLNQSNNPKKKITLHLFGFRQKGRLEMLQARPNLKRMLKLDLSLSCLEETSSMRSNQRVS
jgi:hypothetical protein